MGMSIFDISGRAMGAQLVRLNTTASNMANAGTVSGSAEEAYRARKAVFSATLDRASDARSTVDVERIVSVEATPEQRYEPGHPQADENGFVYAAAVDTQAELVDMLEASRHYQNNVEVLRTAKSLMLNTFRMGS